MSERHLRELCGMTAADKKGYCSGGSQILQAIAVLFVG